MPIITSLALITAYAGLPAARPSSSTASLVIAEVMTCPPPTSILTCSVVAPFFTSTIMSLMRFHALILICPPPSSLSETMLRQNGLAFRRQDESRKTLRSVRGSVDHRQPIIRADRKLTRQRNHLLTGILPLRRDRSGAI